MMGIVILVSIVSYSRLLRGILTYKTTLIKHQPFLISTLQTFELVLVSIFLIYILTLGTRS